MERFLPPVSAPDQRPSQRPKHHHHKHHHASSYTTRYPSTCHPEPTPESGTQHSRKDPTPQHIQPEPRTLSHSPCWSQQTNTTHDHPHEAPPSEQHPPQPTIP